MPFTVNDITVPWSIQWDQWVVSGSQSSANATIPFRVNWNDHQKFISEVMGYPTKVGGVGVVAYPLLYPYSSGTLLAQSFDVSWCGSLQTASNQTQVPNSVIVTVGFSTVPYETDTSNGSSVAFVSIDCDYSGEFVTNPGSGYKFSTSGKPVDKGVGMAVPQKQYKVTLHNLTEVDDTLFDEYIGKVNADQFQLTVKGLAIDCSPGCVLFVGASSKNQGTTSDDAKYQIEMTFIARPPGYEHNKLFDPSTGVWDYVVVESGVDDTGEGDEGEVQSIYDEIDMMGVFSGEGGQ